LIPTVLRRLKDDPEEVFDLIDSIRKRIKRYSRVSSEDIDSPKVHAEDPSEPEQSAHKLSLKETARLALEFCTVWFLANYFAAGCLEYTTVGSATILNSTSSIWTLIAGSLIGVERFSLRKLLCVLASLMGVALISSMDVAGGDDADRGSFPKKTAAELAIGDTLALIAAMAYGIYAVFLKKRIGDESRVDMPLFFGLVGLTNTLLAWPGFILLHVLGIETFSLPPTWQVLTIILFNSAASLISDFCWAYAMLLTSPLVVTVGLSLTIPLSLVGQMVLHGLYTSLVYWAGAAVVVMSFVFINHEEVIDEQAKLQEEEAWESGILRRENLEH
jgi:solute carrier family 35 protein F5